MNKEQKGQILTDCIKFVKLPKIVTIAIKATSKLPNKKLYFHIFVYPSQESHRTTFMFMNQYLYILAL